jgi:hypothetical protein
MPRPAIRVACRAFDAQAQVEAVLLKALAPHRRELFRRTTSFRAWPGVLPTPEAY